MAKRWHNQCFILFHFLAAPHFRIASNLLLAVSQSRTTRAGQGQGTKRFCAGSWHRIHEFTAGMASAQTGQKQTTSHYLLKKDVPSCLPDRPGWLCGVSHRPGLQFALQRRLRAAVTAAQTFPRQSSTGGGDPPASRPAGSWRLPVFSAAGRHRSDLLLHSDPQSRRPGTGNPVRTYGLLRLRLESWREQLATGSASRRGGGRRWMELVATAAVRDPGGAALPGGFWSAVRVWLEKPQVANRRLSGAAVQAEGTVPLGEGGEMSPSFATAGAGGGGGGQEGRAAGAAELGRLWREVRGQLALPPPLTGWGGPGELRAVLRTLLPRGRPTAPPARELAVQGEREGPGLSRTCPLKFTSFCWFSSWQIYLLSKIGHCNKRSIDMLYYPGLKY